ncbi:hypothetical protein [Adhaeribacter aquaticus]|uniref:hypothetical protein n=1 Tax=Adhaeribacter aquaticus TaxID=299567 RepID=UPI0003FFC6BA|nr:hypothetical protein [Adhaeribacter aquaticus]
MIKQLLPQQIVEKVSNLSFSNVSSYELMSFANGACTSFPTISDKNSQLKAQIIQIRDTQIRPLLEEDLLKEDRKIKFYNAKESLVLVMKEYLATNN